jgi:hypothetical protein
MMIFTLKIHFKYYLSFVIVIHQLQNGSYTDLCTHRLYSRGQVYLNL